MIENFEKKLHWNFYCWLIILSFFSLEILRWQILPQFMDMYYHLLCGWGFVKAGGYSGWDFWQYAPFGRMHIYPPLFHLFLAFFIKIGANKVILAKSIEALVPVLFLFNLWLFIKRNYTERLAFFVVLALCSSFSFYLSLSNNIPATLALILGLYALDQLLNNKSLRCVLLLVLSFYTHIGVPCFFAVGILIYGLLFRECRRKNTLVFILTAILAAPILLKQFEASRVISLTGIIEKYFCEFKIIDYCLAIFGLFVVTRSGKRYPLFLSLFIASFIFLAYPYRFFSGQGYLAVVFVVAAALDALWQKLQAKGKFLQYLFLIVTGGYFLFFSPTLLMERSEATEKVRYKIYLADSALDGMLFPERNKRIASESLWFPEDYLYGAEIISQNSKESDIIYSDLRLSGVALSSISGRPSANGLFPEVDASREFNPYSVSKIIILSKDNPQSIYALVKEYGLLKIGESKMFLLYKNPSCNVEADMKRAPLGFRFILFISLTYALMFWQSKNIESALKIWMPL